MFSFIRNTIAKLFGDGATNESPPPVPVNRNVRNNNPLNIRRTSDVWEGQCARQTDREFVQFLSPEYGFRAAYKILNHYRNVHELTTIDAIVHRWAPNSENHCQGYINYLAEHMGISANDTLMDHQMAALMLHMANFEGAKGAFDDQQIKAGMAMA